MDDLIVSFYRQYLQQVSPSTLRYPPAKILATWHIQHQLYRFFFDNQSQPNLPGAEYQRKVLKKILAAVELELSESYHDDDEYGILDELMTHMGFISAVPQQTEAESAQLTRTLSYFIPSSNSEIEGQRRILIRESPNLLAAGSNVGLRTWEACLHLAYYLCTCPRLNTDYPGSGAIADANVLELGAGTGLLSLICAYALDARHVVATDGLSHVVRGIKDNIELNITANRRDTHRQPVAAILDWTDTSNLDTILQLEGSIPNYNYILGADITYHPDLFDPLAHLLKDLKLRFPNAKVLIGATVRNEGSLRLFKQLCSDSYNLTIKEVTTKEWKCPAFRDQTGLFHEQAFPIIIMDIDYSPARIR